MKQIVNVFLQGLFAVGMNDIDVLEELGIFENDINEWNTGQISRPMSDVIAALHTKVQEVDAAYETSPSCWLSQWTD